MVDVIDRPGAKGGLGRADSVNSKRGDQDDGLGQIPQEKAAQLPKVRPEQARPASSLTQRSPCPGMGLLASPRPPCEPQAL
jgi:hypothetical protein